MNNTPRDWPTPSPETKAAIFEAVGTSVQNGANFADHYLPERVTYSIVENLIESDWLRSELGRIAIDAMTAIRRQIAIDIQAARPTRLTRDYTPVDAAYDNAARIARGGVA